MPPPKHDTIHAVGIRVWSLMLLCAVVSLCIYIYIYVCTQVLLCVTAQQLQSSGNCWILRSYTRGVAQRVITSHKIYLVFFFVFVLISCVLDMCIHFSSVYFCVWLKRNKLSVHYICAENNASMIKYFMYIFCDCVWPTCVVVWERTSLEICNNRQKFVDHCLKWVKI